METLQEGVSLRESMNGLIESISKLRVPRTLRDRKKSTSIDDELAIAAFEAHRHINGDKHFHNKAVRILSYVVVILTFIAPFVIFFAYPPKDHGLTWDRFGLLSTAFLLAITFGADTIKNFISEVLDGGEEGSLRISVIEVLLLLFCVFVGWQAWKNLNSIHKFELKDQTANPFIYSLYFWHVVFIWVISFTFLFMDLAVAHGSRVHRQSFAASSSFVHSTAPMLFGNSLILIWCGLGNFWSDRADLQMMHFVTGALTFQMIASNLLFVAVNEDWVIKLCRKLSYSTGSP